MKEACHYKFNTQFAGVVYELWKHRLSLTILHAADTAILKLSHFSLPNKTPTMLE